MMYKFVTVFILCYICIVGFILIDVGEAGGSKTLSHHRNKRYLALLNGSRFYLKFNFKSNMVPWNQLFAQAIGFRMNWNDPPDTFRPHHRIYRRDVYDYIETLLDRNGLSGYHCVQRAICEMENVSEFQKVYHNMLKIIFRKLSPMAEKWHNTTADECRMSTTICPFSLLEAARYTDLA